MGYLWNIFPIWLVVHRESAIFHFLFILVVKTISNDIQLEPLLTLQYADMLAASSRTELEQLVNCSAEVKERTWTIWAKI